MNLMEHETNQTIAIGLGRAHLGMFLVASSDKGIRAILLADSEDELLRELARELPGIPWRAGGRDYDHVVQSVGQLIERPAAKFELLLDTNGGDFEQLTRAAIRAMPAGKIVSPDEIAKMVGASRESARYVAELCARNVIAVAIPCHRVGYPDGTRLPYRWGEHRRRALLERERLG
jgi:AraC family transcriptional regulator of adaptative response/methylated-DNA-[protein]-cysteine methyltransferase